jgi:two-component system, OmpR family, KDP operon response regulator KdpE
MSVVLLVEDDTLLRRALRASLRQGDFEVREVATGEDALVVVANEHPDLVVLDLGLPGMDGLETLRHVRSFSKAPVVVLTVRDQLRDKVAALDWGADDYVLKPFETEELLARVRALLRRAAAQEPGPVLIRAGDLEVDLARRRVTWAGAPVRLTPTEHRLLEVLVANRGKLLTRDELVSAVWRSRWRRDRDRLRRTVLDLRRKLHDDAARPRLIFTEPGLGYRWIAEHEEQFEEF